MVDRNEEKKPDSISIEGNVVGGAVGGGKVDAEQIAGGDIHNIGADAQDAADAFAKIYQMIDEKSFESEQTSKDVKEAVEVIKSENAKGDDANETSLKFSFRMLAQMAPDIFDVVVATVTSPIRGISTVVQKIAKKAKEDKGDAE